MVVAGLWSPTFPCSRVRELSLARGRGDQRVSLRARTSDSAFTVVLSRRPTQVPVVGRWEEVGSEATSRKGRWARRGMVRPSFVPPPEIRELRELTRYRKS